MHSTYIATLLCYFGRLHNASNLRMARTQQSIDLHKLSPDLNKQSLGAPASSLDEAIKSLSSMVPVRLTENFPGKWNLH